MSKFGNPALPNCANIPGFAHIEYISPYEALGLGSWYPAQRGEPGLDEQLPSTPDGKNEYARHQDLGPSDQGETLDHVEGIQRREGG